MVKSKYLENSTDFSEILEKINLCTGLSNALRLILLTSVCNNDFSEEKCNCFLALAESLDEKLNLLAVELRNKL